MRNFGIFSFHRFWKLKKNHGLENTIFWNSDQKNRKKILFAIFFKPKMENQKKVWGYLVRRFFNIYFQLVIFWSLPSAHEIILKFTFLERASPHSISKQAYFISISEHCNWRHNALEYKVIVPRNWFLLLPINLPTYLWSSYKF